MTEQPTNLGYSQVGKRDKNPLEGVRIAGLQFLPTVGGAAILVPQEVIVSLARIAVKPKPSGASLARLVEAIEQLRCQVHVLAGVVI